MHFINVRAIVMTELPQVRVGLYEIKWQILKMVPKKARNIISKCDILITIR